VLILVMAYMEAMAEGRVYSDNLEIISREQGLEGLIEQFNRALGRAGLADNELIQTALTLGVDLHANDRRTYEPYTHHLVRVAILLVEELGVRDPEVIAAAPLHDSVEDHARELAEMKFDDVPDEVHLQRQLAHRALVLIAGEETADIVLEVSNPLLEPEDDKIAEYSRHNTHLVLHGSPGAAALKLSDVLDNTRPAMGEDPNKRQRLDRKQVPIYGVHAAGLARPDSIVVPEARPGLLTVLSERHLRALGRLSGRADALSENSLRTA
jgi:(p)ppGpp synthase/HD superfamily hydrolase